MWRLPSSVVVRARSSCSFCPRYPAPSLLGCSSLRSDCTDLPSVQSGCLMSAFRPQIPLPSDWPELAKMGINNEPSIPW